MTGALETPAQKAEAIARTRYIAGVRGVVDELRVANDNAVSPVRYQPVSAARRPTGPPVEYRRAGPDHDGPGGDYVRGPMGGGVRYGTSRSRHHTARAHDGGPVPEGRPACRERSQAAQPGYPNYAWPSYAPYPNFSAVGYPTAYPWQAWPNIGPFYPYPEVPLDWRAVTLRWDDGIWWLDFKKHYTRPFFTPYPFGLFAY